MTTVNSVLGTIETANLGFTLMHEHIMVAPAGIFQDHPDLLNTRLMEHIVDGLKKAKEGGVDTIVDATTPDIGRHINLIAEASRLSGVNIIACSGWWLDIPHAFAGMSADQLAGIFTAEIEQGIAGTSIKAGILKAASDIGGMTPEEDIVLRAVARAHHQTGVPIMLHSYSPGQVGRQQIAVLREEGVHLNRVKLDHSNDTTDMDYLTWILEQGCYLGLDRYPGHIISSAARTRTMKALIDAGYADRLCPSHDEAMLFFMAADPDAMDEERLMANPYRYLYIKKVVFPQLREMGVSEAVVNSLCVAGPRNFFEGV